jgi:RHH-type transcriptional regulator, proline utilization regulon repressor / proline dehydrogenase / delta 1-pyrroline-5-carboxylate dehydrogenase
VEKSVEVGNAYINRPITGAIVRSQPFGGWKNSSFGPGAKAGGPNYCALFGEWHNTALPQTSACLTEKIGNSPPELSYRPAR